jgi:hypothetical protein
MPPVRTASLVLFLVVALAGAVPVRASERSELLVAQGEVAYSAGRLEEARARFSEALAADPEDQAARGWLDLLGARAPRAATTRGERPEREARIWDLEVGTGVEYDSNVRLDHKDPHDDAGFLFTLAGHVDPYRDDRTLVRLDYDFFQVLHTEETDFDVRSNRFRGTLSRAIVPGTWVGLQGGYDHTTLDSHAYLQEPWVMPFASIVEGDFGATQFVYRHTAQDYLGSPFGGTPINRDGSLDAGGITQLIYLFDRRLALTLAYTYEQASPFHASGNDFARNSHVGDVGLRFQAWWRVLVDVSYQYREDGYTEPNSIALPAFVKRKDEGHYVTTYLRRPIFQNLDAVLSYFATVNGSNLALYDYHRHVVALEMRYSF